MSESGFVSSAIGEKVDRLKTLSNHNARTILFGTRRATRMNPLCGLLIALGIFVLPRAIFAQTSADEGLKFFEEKIRPVLDQQCYSCHSVAAQTLKKLQGRLFLDSADGILDGGESGSAIVKGKSAESLLLKALKYDGLEMPPTGKLSDQIVADFARWIDMGAPDPRVGAAVSRAKREINLAEGRQWWAFQPLKPVTPLSASPIDGLIVEAQQQHGLTSGKPANRQTLIRRAYFDLIGLPPTLEQVDTFVNDHSPQAFEKVVDELLNSPRYGEKWARHWLDAARFAESGGYEFDGFRAGAYHYRDWVIRALNSDLPYDQFVKLQLAGDLLQPDSLEAAAAVGFLVAGPYPGQITAKTVERIRYDQLDDMLMTIGGSMLGLTLGCVRCHEHKYDPLPHQDYYALAATLAKTAHGPRTMDVDPAATLQAQEKHQRDHQLLQTALQTFSATQLPARFESWRAAELPRQPDSPRWQVLQPIAFSAERSWLKQIPGGILAQDGSLEPGVKLRLGSQQRTVGNAERFQITFQTFQKNVTALRLDMFADKSLPSRGPGLNGDGSFQLVEIKLGSRPLDPRDFAIQRANVISFQSPAFGSPIPAAPADSPVPAVPAFQEQKFKPVYAAFADQDQPLGHAVDGKPETAWVVRTTAKNDNAAVLELETPLVGFADGTELQLELTFRDLGIGRLRVSLSTEANPATLAGDVQPQHLGEIRSLLAANGNTVPERLRLAIARWFAPFDVETAKFVGAVRDHAAAMPRPNLSEVYTTIAGGQDVFFLRRGEVDNKQGKAEPGFIQVLSRPRGSLDRQDENPGTSQIENLASAQRPSNAVPVDLSSDGSAPAAVDPRVSLAQWITDLDRGAGPLLARVIVNRLWQHHFGRGIVGTPNDFGVQGERPSHPELLELLAGELVRSGWKLKPLHRLMMLSETYQQSAEINDQNLKRDPVNKYLWHFQTRRLQAELIRDSLLAVGGNLDLTMYGPSILDTTPRRSVYLRVKRSELLPIMTMFDAPEPTQSIGERVSTTVPTQALALMNSPFVHQQAEKLAARIRPSADLPLATTVDRAYQTAFARLPNDRERARMVEFIELQSATIGEAADAVNKAMVEFCHVLLCLNEFVYVD